MKKQQQNTSYTHEFKAESVKKEIDNNLAYHKGRS
jgi:hypothetical protein